MIAAALRLELERYAGDRPSAHLSAPSAGVHAERVQALVTTAEELLPIARDRARATGHHRLAAFYEARLVERTSCSPLGAPAGPHAKDDPRLHLAALLFAEYAPVALGLASDDGRARVELMLDAIDDLVPDPRQLSPLRAALRDAMSRFDALYVETNIDPRVAAGTARQQASAA